VPQPAIIPQNRVGGEIRPLHSEPDVPQTLKPAETSASMQAKALLHPCPERQNRGPLDEPPLSR